MSKDVKPITSTQFTKTEERSIEFGGGAAAEAPQNEADAQTVKVKALRTFPKDGDPHGELVNPDSDPFDCPRGRAAQLRANGLIEYVDATVEKEIHGEVGAKQISDRVERRAEVEKATVEKNKSTPLRNPELKLGEVKEADKPK